MAEPTLAWTFEDYILRVAEYLGVAYYGASGNEAAQVPTDAHNLDLCKRIVNDGYRRFYEQNARWNWVLRPFSITFDPDGTGSGVVDGAAWRYYMPGGFYGDIVGRIEYAANSGQGPLVQTEPQTILALRAQAQYAGWPNLYAVRMLPDDPWRRWEMLVHPDPDEADTVTGRCRIYPNKLIQLTDRINAGVQFERAVLACALAEAEQTREDKAGTMNRKADAEVEKAIMLDRQSAPKRLGRTTGAGGRDWYQGVDGYYVGGRAADDYRSF